MILKNPIVMKQLIKENRFEELKQKLNNSNSELKIYHLILRILNNEKIEEEDYGFEANQYQEEFLEGLDLYKAFSNSTISHEQIKVYTSVLVHLVFKMGGFIRLMADTAMNKGVYLSDLGDVYRVNPEIRNELQLFIELLKDKNEIKAIANVAAAKAQISNSIGNLLERHEIGEDMLQFAQSYEVVGQTEMASKIYSGIMNDFGCESVKLSSGSFPEISYVDTRSQEEIVVFEKAKTRFENLTAELDQNINRVHIDKDENANKLVEESHSKEKVIKGSNYTTDQSESTGLFSRIIKFLKKN
ncbi:hypothetical protein [Pedobacter caeni]|uniref:Uncharacterized protein n=1 Tax=Pedobacter caeni TaxID=288992 RepID=A0A1M5BGF6_9SPHI|nr:hypothetical protein [Pedobacter caeni]SHF41644.1 hypothetical protein SAMN04488522_1021188 [Pedobacter caeni]